jgi:hypothetical protein
VSHVEGSVEGASLNSNKCANVYEEKSSNLILRKYKSLLLTTADVGSLTLDTCPILSNEKNFSPYSTYIRPLDSFKNNPIARDFRPEVFKIYTVGGLSRPVA